MIAPVLNPPHSEDMVEVTWNFFQSIMVALPTLWAKGSRGTSEHSQGGTTGYFEKATFDISERQANHYLKKADLFHWTVLCFSTTFYAEATEFSKSSITKTWRAQESTWKKKQGVRVWCENLSCSKPSGASSWTMSKYLGVFNGKPKDDCPSVYTRGHVWVNMWVSAMWEKLLRQLMSARDAFSKVPSIVRFYRQHQFSSPSTVWETPNQVLRFLFSVFQMLLCALFPHVRTRVRFLGGKFVRTLTFPSASPSRCNLFLLTHSRRLEVRLSLHQKQTSIQRSRFHEPGKSTH